MTNATQRTPQPQQQQAQELLQHAEWHCLFGSNCDGTERTPEQGDVDAARLLAVLRRNL